MLKTLPLRHFLSLLSFIFTLALLQPAVHAATLGPDVLLGTDTEQNRQHFLENLRSLERQLIGTQPDNQDRLLTQASHHRHADIYMSYYDENSGDDPREFYVMPKEGEMRSDIAQDGTAWRMRFRWSDYLTWGERQWEAFDASKHQGMQAMRLTPLSRRHFSANVAKVGRLVVHPDGWSVCRIALPRRKTYIYGYYDGVNPYCVLGDPKIMQWDAEQEIWQVPFIFAEETDLIPRLQKEFSVLPSRFATKQHVLSNLVQIDQQARGFAVDRIIDHRDSLWPSDQMGYRVWRLVNQQGILDFTVRVHEKLVITPTQCALQLEIPATVGTEEPLQLTYTTSAQRNTLTSGRYRCTVDGGELRQWLETQREQHPYAMAEIDVGDLAFLSVQLQYGLAPVPSADIKAIFALSRLTHGLVAFAPQMQNAIERWYQVTRPYEHSFWLRLFYPSYAEQNRVLAAFRGKNLVKVPFKQLVHLVQNGFPEDERESMLPYEWASLQTIGEQVAQVMGDEFLSENIGEFPDGIAGHAKTEYIPYWPILQALHATKEFGETEHQKYQQLHTRTAGSPLTGTYYPLPVAVEHDAQYQRVRSYAYDQLSADADDPMLWRLVAVDGKDQATADPQVPDKIMGNYHFTIQPKKRYRLYLKQDAAEAWAASHLYLAAGQLEGFTADSNSDDGYYLTFPGEQVPTILQYQSRTRDGRVYDTSLTFSIWSRQQLDLMPEIVREVLVPAAHELAGISQLNHTHIDLEMTGNGGRKGTELTLKLKDTAGGPNIQHSGVTARLSDCLERLDQGPQPCAHSEAFTPWSSEDAKPRQLSQPLNKITPRPWSNNLKQLAKTFPIDDTKPQQLTVRIPQQDQQGNTRGYQQRWYTFYDPEQQYRRYSAQNITQGVDPLMIRSVIWQIRETVGQNIPVRRTRTILKLTDDVAAPEALREAIADYNHRDEAMSSLVYGIPAIQEIDEGLDDIQPDQSPAFFKPDIHTISQEQPDIATLVYQGQQLPSFIYPTHELPAGSYTFQQTSILQAGVVEECHGHNLCVAGLQPAWEASAPYRMTETFTLTVQEPEEPYTSGLMLTPSQSLATIAPGVQWQAAAEMIGPGQYLLPYAYPAWNLHSLRNHTEAENTVAEYLPPRQLEQRRLAEALRAMGYQPVTHRLRFCDTQTGDCESLSADDAVGSLAKKIRAYDYLQLESAQGDTLTIDIHAGCTQDDKPDCMARDLLAAGAIAYLGAERQQLAAEYQIAGMRLLKLQGAYTGLTDAAHITEVTLSYPEPENKLIDLYVAPNYQTIEANVEMTAEDWIQLPPQSGFSNKNNQLYIDLDQFAADRFCIQIVPEKHEAGHLSVTQLSAVLGEDRKQLEQTEVPGNYCLAADATALWYDSLQQGGVSQLQISITSHTGGESQIVVTAHSLAYVESYLSTVTPGSAVIIENYDPDNALRQFDMPFNTDFVRRVLIDKFRFEAEDIALHISNAQMQLNLSDAADEESTGPWVSYPVTENSMTLPMTQQAEQAALVLQNVLLVGDHWSGQLQADLTVTLAGHDASLEVPQVVAADFYPYLDPQIQLQWLSYHNWRRRNNLNVEIQGSMGQELDLDWVSDNLQDQLSAYYNPVLARLHTDLQVARNVRELVDQVLAEAKASTDQDSTWIWANSFPELYLHIEKQAWEQLSQNPSISLEPAKVHWAAEKDVSQNQWYVLSAAEQQDLFIGLAETDATALRHWNVDSERTVEHYMPEQSVTLYQAADFTMQLAEHEPGGVYRGGADFLQSSWDLFTEEVALDFKKYKESVKDRMISSSRNRESLRLKLDLPKRIAHMTRPKGLSYEDAERALRSVFYIERRADGIVPFKSVELSVQGTMVVDETLLREKMSRHYEYYTSPNNLETIGLNTEYDLAFEEIEISCETQHPSHARRHRHPFILEVRDDYIRAKERFTTDLNLDYGDYVCTVVAAVTPNHLLDQTANHQIVHVKADFNLLNVDQELERLSVNFDIRETAEGLVRLTANVRREETGNRRYGLVVDASYRTVTPRRYRFVNGGFVNGGVQGWIEADDAGVPYTELPVFSPQYQWKEFYKIKNFIQNEDYRRFIVPTNASDYLDELALYMQDGGNAQGGNAQGGNAQGGNAQGGNAQGGGNNARLLVHPEWHFTSGQALEANTPYAFREHILPGHFVKLFMLRARNRLRMHRVKQYRITGPNRNSNQYVSWRVRNNNASQDFYELGAADIAETLYFLSEYIASGQRLNFIRQGSYYNYADAREALRVYRRKRMNAFPNPNDLPNAEMDRIWGADFWFLKAVEKNLFYTDYKEYSRATVGDMLGRLRTLPMPQQYNTENSLLAASLMSVFRADDAVMELTDTLDELNRQSYVQFDTIRYAEIFNHLINSWSPNDAPTNAEAVLNDNGYAEEYRLAPSVSNVLTVWSPPRDEEAFCDDRYAMHVFCVARDWPAEVWNLHGFFHQRSQGFVWAEILRVTAMNHIEGGDEEGPLTRLDRNARIPMHRVLNTCHAATRYTVSCNADMFGEPLPLLGGKYANPREALPLLDIQDASRHDMEGLNTLFNSNKHLMYSSSPIARRFWIRDRRFLPFNVYFRAERGNRFVGKFLWGNRLPQQGQACNRYIDDNNPALSDPPWFCYPVPNEVR